MALALCLLGGGAAFSANWISMPGQTGMKMDTDSYLDSGLRSSFVFEIQLNGKTTLSTIEFDRENKTYRILDSRVLDADGKVEEKETYQQDEIWDKVTPHSFGMNLYTHFVENPLPRFTNPDWVTLYTEKSIRYQGSSYAVEKNTISYKNGYATFWLRLSYPAKDKDFSSAIFHVKMDVPNKRIQSLSMTTYDYEGHVRSHGAGARVWEKISPDTPMDKVHDYINQELLAGRIHMNSSL